MSTNLKFAFPDIPFNASSGISSATYDGDFPVKNLVNGSRGNIAMLASELIGMHQIEYDLGSGNEQSADYLALVDAKKLKSSQVDYVRLRTSDYTYQYPTSALAIFDFDKEVIFDSARRISQVSDQSGNTNHATQITDANKPLLSRADNKENLFINSESFQSTGWIDSGADWASDYFTEDNSNGYHARYQNVNIISGESYTVTVWMKADTRTKAFIWLNNNAGGVVFDLSSGTIDLYYGVGYTATITEDLDIGTGVYKCTVTGNGASTGSLHFGIGIYNGGLTYAGTGTDGLYLYRSKISRSSTDSGYVLTLDTPQHAGINGNRVAVFDGTNDYLIANGIATALSGEDKPFTLIMVIKQDVLKNWTTPFNLGEASGVALHRLDLGASTVVWQYRRDDAASLIQLGSAGSTDELSIITVRFTGTTADLYKDGTAIYSNQAANVGTATFTRFTIGILSDFASQPLQGKIAFMAVVDSALGTSDREAWEGYLTNRYSTAPIIDIDLQNVTLTGGQGKDYITTFSESANRRYWILQFITNTASSKRPLSKAYFGKLLDLNRDPQLGLRASSLYHQDKAMHHKKGLSLSYKGITTTKRQEFETKIGQYKDTNEVLLHTTTYDAPLINSDLLSAEVKSANFQMHGASQNDLEIELEETI